jgi:hypothetical protein
MTRGTGDSLNLSYSGRGRTWKDVAVIAFLAIVLGAFAFQLVRGPSAPRHPADEMAASPARVASQA